MLPRPIWTATLITSQPPHLTSMHPQTHLNTGHTRVHVNRAYPVWLSNKFTSRAYIAICMYPLTTQHVVGQHPCADSRNCLLDRSPCLACKRRGRSHEIAIKLAEYTPAKWQHRLVLQRDLNPRPVGCTFGRKPSNHIATSVSG